VLKSLDILIGLIVVLLALSMAVTVITQSITTIINSRGRHLRRGLVDLLQQLDPALTATLSKEIASALLSHPLVSGSNTGISGKPRLGNVIHREEFTKLLMTFAAGQGGSQLGDTAKTALETALKNNQIPNPAEALTNIRRFALQLEKSAPEMSHVVRQNLAILHAAESDFVAKVNNWFDQTMDRTSQRFTASTRVVTFAGAFIVAFGLQVDTPAVVNRLAADDHLRAELVKNAQTIAEQRATEMQTETKATASTPAPPPSEQTAQKTRDLLGSAGIITLPSAGLSTWWRGFGRINLFGVLITALLLSLGAPFWYNALGQALKLRSALASKDDAQRKARQSSDSGTAAKTT
jgi:hypothetical protein